VPRIARQKRQAQAQGSNQEEKAKVEDSVEKPMNTERELLCSNYEKPFCGPTNGVHLKRLAAEAEITEAGREKLAKAKRVLPRLVASLVWFWHSVRLLVESLELTEAAERAVYEQLLPGLYWARAAERGRTAAEKKRLRGLSATCLEKAWSAGGGLSGLSSELQEVLQRVCTEGVSRFVRSSSCVEGRNGQLSLQHHGCHALSPGKLKALTVLHNYFSKREDGTTAAERFFGHKPADLFEWLLQRFPTPARPAKRRPKQAKVAA